MPSANTDSGNPPTSARGSGISKRDLAVGHLAALSRPTSKTATDLGSGYHLFLRSHAAGNRGAFSETSQTEHSTLVLNGDLLTNVNFGTIVRHHSECGAAATIGTKRRTETVQFASSNPKPMAGSRSIARSPISITWSAWYLCLLTGGSGIHSTQNEIRFPGNWCRHSWPTTNGRGYETLPIGWILGAPTTTKQANIDFPEMESLFLNQHVEARLSELEFDETELNSALDAIDSGWITAGRKTQAFEEAFAKLREQRKRWPFANGTAALMLALKSLRNWSGR